MQSKQHPIFFFLFLFFCAGAMAQQTPFERSGGQESATYFEAINFYKQLDKASAKVQVKEMGSTDAGYPLHLVMVSADGRFDPAAWHKQQKIVVLVINGIHPGEPDGIDASMMLVRDIVQGKTQLPSNVCFGIIPVYNIGGALNRGTTSRANQNGPKEYGFRGNAQNLDLNRDFTKCDSKNAKAFTQIFHYLDPEIQIDNHVSDGADYQHVFTLITTQPDKLGGGLGDYLRNSFEPSLYKGMQQKGWDICPYVNFDNADASKGMEAFYDSPRYSSGYAALWQTMSFIPETHMLKPYKDRTLSTYAFMQTVMDQAAVQAAAIIAKRAALRKAIVQSNSFALGWKTDSAKYQSVEFKGYERDYKKSEVTGMQRMFYNHDKPYSKNVPFYNTLTGTKQVEAPSYYVIPQGWHKIADLLRLNKVQYRQLTKDTIITVLAYKIRDYKASPRAYESHHRNTDVRTETVTQTIRFLKGDYIIDTHQPARRFLVEMLEPTGDDSYFSWNYFDAILQQKEGYSDYRWEDVAAQVLKENPVLQQELDEKRKTDPAFANNASAQLNWVYQHSAYYEPAHMRYPVYRIL